MLESREGQHIPEVTFRTRRGGEWRDVGTAEIFAGKRVVVFSLPGAFTPTCSSAHVPRYQELVPTLEAHGVDEVVCVMKDNVGKVMMRGERLDDLHDKSGLYTLDSPIRKCFVTCFNQFYSCSRKVCLRVYMCVASMAV